MKQTMQFVLSLIIGAMIGFVGASATISVMLTSLAYFLSATIAFILLIAIGDLPSFARTFLLFFCIIGYLLALLNGIPLKLGGKQSLLCAIAFYLENNRPKTEEIFHTVCLQKEKYLMQGEVLISIALMASMLADKTILQS